MTSPVPKVFDVAVVGGGVVGLAVARECAARGKTVALLEKEDAFAAGASSGNSGLGCTGYDAPVGSLERKLLRRSIQLHQELYRSFGLSHEHVRKCGSLVVAWNDEQHAELPQVLDENRLAGDNEAILLSAQELREVEPALDHSARGAVLCPYEAVVEPWLVPMGYAESARRFGANLFLRSRVASASRDANANVWELKVENSEDASLGRSQTQKLLTDAHAQAHVRQPLHQTRDDVWSSPKLRARVVVNCAGLWGDELERLTKEPAAKSASFTIRPRKGQFVVFQAPKGDSIPRLIIEPVATQFTKGVIAWTTVYGNIIVGPTAVEQASKTDRATDIETVQRLEAWGRKILPGLRNAKVIGTYAGLRPATEHRDFQVSVSRPGWVTVGGIRSTGLTASPGLGEYIANLVDGIFEPERESSTSPSTSSSSMPGVSAAAASPAPRPSQRLEPVPSLQTLANEYRARGDGCVTLYGRVHRVTHPISSFGMETV
ncbi:NADFAD-dependent dehydrogenase, putative [Hondaea fermentalgiana]|uniref:NADFAD-dependent dehydrogenase, putative n=1 Tax=Hondaea fermentalgiana TaxID=2315210 RepID=A0A2R5GSC6_9STRA|nr:NADFAD-dependent dehydrogenase, putative [Hondaea fermentalgiana]|eukprot:GBG33495.1 NADFAD-dependent dehydrogenase, putative [Hondaea fermentalgiana]